MKIVQLITDDREPHREYATAMPYFGTAPGALLQGFSQMPEVEIHVVSCTQRPMKSPAKLADNIYFHSLLVPKIGWLKTGYQGCIRAVRRKLRELQPDIVHGQGSERDQNISAVFSGFPNVATVHGNMANVARHLKARPGSFLWLAGHLEDFVLPRAGGVFCNSAYTESLVRPRNPRTWRVPNAVREAFFVPLPPSEPADGRVRLLNIGVICSRKRQLEVLALFERLHRRGFTGYVDFIGTCSPQDAYGREFLKAIRLAEAEGYARYSGSFGVEALVSEMDRSQACIHFPSEEAFGLVVAEAMARNLKFFGVDVGGVPDIARGVDGAELFGTDDWKGLEVALGRWIQQGCPRPLLARQTMMERYHPRLIAARHLEIYREVLSRK